MRTVLFGLIGGLVGAAVWACVSAFANLEIGWLAWGIGVLVGIGCRLGLPKSATPSRNTPGIAGAIAIVAIILGKVTAAAIVVASLPPPEPITEDDKIAQIALNMAEEIELSGGFVDWPSAQSVAPSEPRDFPSDLWFAAARDWRNMTDEHKRAFEAVYFAEDEQNAVSPLAVGLATLMTVSPWDALWLFLAVASAWQIAAVKPVDQEVFNQAPTRIAEPSAGPLASIPPPSPEEQAQRIPGLPMPRAVDVEPDPQHNGQAKSVQSSGDQKAA